MLKLYFIILFMLCTAKAFSQQFYANTSDNKLYLVTITPTGPVSTQINGCGTGNYFSIAIFGSEIFYNSVFGTLYQADLVNGSVPIVANCKTLANNVFGDALTIDANGVLYFANSNQLYSYNTKNPGVVNIGTMPFSASGDLAFYNNQLYMAAAEGIVSVNLSDPSKSSLYIPMPGYFVFGLATVKLNGTDVMYALTSTGNGTTTDLLQLDMVAKVIKADVGTLPYTVFDAGSTSESGTVPVIMLDSIGISHECDAYNKADVTVYLKTDTNKFTYTYSLNTGQTNTTGIFTGLPPATYQLHIMSSGNEISKDTSFVIPDFTVNNPVISAALVNPACSSKGQINLDAGIADSLYLIQYGTDTFKFAHSFTGLSAGIYHFTMLNKQGCIIDEKDYTLTQAMCPPIVIDSVQMKQECNVFNEANITIFTRPHTDTYTYILNTGQTDTTGVFTGLPPATYQLQITPGGNEAIKDTSFVIPDFTANATAINATLVNPICDIKGQIKLDAGISDSSYLIQYGTDTFKFAHSFTGLNAGIYHFTILNKQGCIINEKDYTLIQDICPMIVVDSVQVKPECDIFGEASVTILTQPHSDKYVYNFNNITDTTGVFDDIKPGSYPLTITSSDGNQIQQTVIVPDYTLNAPIISYKVSNAVCSQPGAIKFTLTGNLNSAIQIKHGSDLFSLDQTITGLSAGNNHFTILNTHGCVVDTIDVNVPYVECDNQVVFPNTFTPNGDNINDIFRPKQDSNPSDYKLMVFNRFGVLLFQSNSFFIGWDGKYKGNPVPVGVYYWVASYRLNEGEKRNQSGYIMLLR